MTGPHPDPLDPIQNLEPPAVAALGVETGPLSFEGVVMISQAISLKRIADALDALTALTHGDGVHQLHTALYGAVSNLAWEAGRNFQAGTRTDR